MPASSMLAFSGGQIYIAGGRGPAGPAGPAGSATLAVTAGEDIVVNRLVYASNGSVFHCDPTDINKSVPIGLSTQSVSSGGQVDILTFGERNDGGWAWGTNCVLYLGASGALTATPPTTGTLVRVGLITSPTSVIIQIQQPLILS